MRKKCFNGNTVYQLLVFLLITDGRIEEKRYIFNENFSDKILKNFKEKIIIKTPLSSKNKYKRLMKILYFFIKIRIILHTKEMLEYRKCDIYGESIYSPLLKKNNSLYLLEDGIGNYIFPKDERKKSLITLKRLLFSLVLGKKILSYGGKDKRIERIYLTGLAKIPKAIKDKVEIINLEELWNKKSEEEKKQINEIFGVDIDILQKIEDRKIILFTQPLSEDGIISEEEKIEIYSKILEKYRQKDIIIKPHPREKTNYSDYFSNCYVMKEKYPVELMIFNGLKVERAITLFSTAVFSLNKMAKVDFYGTEVHPKLLERFGSMDHIIKRNCYL